MLVVVGDYRGDFCLLLQGRSVLFSKLRGYLPSLQSAVDEQMNGKLILPEDLISTLVAQSSTLQQHNFAPVAKSDISVCITVLDLTLSLSLCHTHPVTYVFIHYRSKLDRDHV